MGILERRLKSTRPIVNVVQRALLNIELAFAHFTADFERVVGAEGLAPGSFNVLRILRAAPDGLPRGEIGSRLVLRGSDVTRLIDGLVRRGFVKRVRAVSDRRLSVARITKKGLAAVNRLDAPVERLMAEYERLLSPGDWSQLSQLLEAIYAEEVE